MAAFGTQNSKWRGAVAFVLLSGVLFGGLFVIASCGNKEPANKIETTVSRECQTAVKTLDSVPNNAHST
jgi:hypothetical protein